jgi:hypothetical protein
MRLLTSAFAAGVASLVLPVALDIIVFFEGPGIDAAGRPDNDPYRAAAVLLMLTPAFLVLATGYFVLATWALRHLDRLSRATLLALSAAVALAIALFFAERGFQSFGVRDAAISFFLFGSFSFCSLAVGSVVLWRLRPAA